MSFRDNLQHLRDTRNMTQSELAMLVGVSRQSVAKWEAEKSYPEMDKLLKLCDLFECTLDDLVRGDLTGRAPDPTRSLPEDARPSTPAATTSTCAAERGRCRRASRRAHAPPSVDGAGGPRDVRRGIRRGHRLLEHERSQSRRAPVHRVLRVRHGGLRLADPRVRRAWVVPAAAPVHRGLLHGRPKGRRTEGREAQRRRRARPAVRIPLLRQSRSYCFGRYPEPMGADGERLERLRDAPPSCFSHYSRRASPCSCMPPWSSVSLT